MTNVPASISSPAAQSLKNDIHALEGELQASRNRQDWWNGWYLKLGVAALVFATFLGIASWVCQKKASTIEYASRPNTELLAATNARLRETLDHESKTAVARAEQHSAEANAKAEGFRLDIAKANESARVAEARSAEAALELARFKAPRSLAPTRMESLANSLRAFGAQKVDLIIVGDSSEIVGIANPLVAAMQQGGWEVKYIGKAISGPNWSGVLVGTHAGANPNIVGAAVALISSLNAAGIYTASVVPPFDDKIPMAINGHWDEKNIAPIRVYVCTKP